MILVTEGDESFEVTMTATEMREGELETQDPSQTEVHVQLLGFLYLYCWK